jgi:hypothetical protein
MDRTPTPSEKEGRCQKEDVPPTMSKKVGHRRPWGSRINIGHDEDLGGGQEPRQGSNASTTASRASRAFLGEKTNSTWYRGEGAAMTMRKKQRRPWGRSRRGRSYSGVQEEATWYRGEGAAMRKNWRSNVGHEEDLGGGRSYSRVQEEVTSAMRKILEAATAECRYVNGSIIESFTGFFL